MEIFLLSRSHFDFLSSSLGWAESSGQVKTANRSASLLGKGRAGLEVGVLFPFGDRTGVELEKNLEAEAITLLSLSLSICHFTFETIPCSPG